MTERYKEHLSYIKVGYAEKSALAEHSPKYSHEVLFDQTTVLAKSTSYSQCIVRESLEIQIEPTALN